jgi:hypothetical protein
MMTILEQLTVDQLRLSGRLNPEQSEQILHSNVEGFIRAGDWGVDGANDRYDIVYSTWNL